jgi:ABC-type Mn2+/Zn2+ transport system permease subunit
VDDSLLQTLLQTLLLDPLRPAFMQRAMLAVLMIGALCGVVGAYVVTRRMAFLGDAMAHTILPGVAIAFVLSNNDSGWVMVGGFIAGILSALLIGLLTRGGRLSEDTAIGVVFAGALALGIGLISLSGSYSTDLAHLLIGNVLAVDQNDVWLIAAVGLVVLVCVVALYKEMLLVSFDAVLAQTLRLPAEPLRLLLLVLLSLTVVVSIQAVGVALVAALLVTPAATARFFTRRLHHMMLLSAALGAGGSVVGMYIAWHTSIAPSAAMVLTLTAAFLVAASFAPGRGALARLRARRRMA